jgi:hypothetical protein
MLSEDSTIMAVPWLTVTVPARSRAAREFYCPVCGSRIYGQVGRGVCPHLILAYIEETGALDYCLPEHEADALLAAIDCSTAQPVQVLADRLSGESVFLLRIQAESDVSGPSTTVVGIDLNPRLEEL